MEKSYNFFTGRTREQDLAEEAARHEKSEKITQFVIVICIAAIITAVGNVMDGKHLFGDSLIGVAVLAGLATIGAMISYLPMRNKLPNGILGVV